MRRGLTILDVLIGTLIVGMLGALAYPMLRPATTCGHASSCLSKVKQLGLATLLYVEDESQHFPRSVTWMDSTYPYTRSSDLYHCPTVQAMNPKWFGYAFDDRLSMRKIQKLPDLATASVIFESTRLSRNAHDAFVSFPKTGRHHDTNSVVFADGHAKATRSR